VHHVDVVSLDQLLGRLGRPPGKQPAGRNLRRRRVAARDGGEDATCCPHRPGMDAADEAGADDARSRKPCHRTSRSDVIGATTLRILVTRIDTERTWRPTRMTIWSTRIDVNVRR
jgi:hypothetical protein